MKILSTYSSRLVMHFSLTVNCFQWWKNLSASSMRQKQRMSMKNVNEGRYEAKNVNEGRYSKFYGKKKTPESQELPPTVDALLYHCKRVFYATAIIKQSLQPRPQSNFKKMALATHDFAGNFHLIWFVNCKTIEINLCNVVNFS